MCGIWNVTGLLLLLASGRDTPVTSELRVWPEVLILNRSLKQYIKYLGFLL